MGLLAPPGEWLARLGVAVFGALALALSVGRSLWFRARHGRRPVAPPRGPRERAWHVLWIAAIALAFALCASRLGGDRWYRWMLPLRALETALGAALSIAASVAGFGVALLAQSQMGASWRIGVPEERTALVTSGLYARARNPIYAGFVLAAAGLLALLPSAGALALLALSAAIVRAWASIEEARQLELHGDAYRRYCERTGRFLPRLGQPATTSGPRSNSS